MLNFDRIDVSERIDVNKAIASKGYDICHYWYFSNYSFTFRPNVCNRCHDLLMYTNLGYIATLDIKVSYYRCVISLISKNRAINLMRTTDSIKKRVCI